MRTGEMLFKRRQWLQVFQPNTTTTLGFWLPLFIQAAQINNFGEITALFDQYKITGMAFEFHPKFDNYSGSDISNAGGITNQYGVQVDICYDNKTTVGYSPTGSYGSSTYNKFLEQGRCKHITNPNRPFKMYTRPVVQRTIDGTSTNMWISAPWMPTTNTSTYHYGFNLFFHDVNFAAAGLPYQAYDVYLTTYVKARNLR